MFILSKYGEICFQQKKYYKKNIYIKVIPNCKKYLMQ